MKKVLITGSEGFAGQHLVEALKKDYFIIGLSHREKLKSWGKVVYEIGDIQNQVLIYELMKKYQPDVIIHLAAIAFTWDKKIADLFDVNLFGTLNIFESVLRLKANGYNPKIIYISSADVYGKTTTPDDIGEDAPFFPINYYAVSKVAADRLSYQYSQTNGLNVIIARPFNHTGPGQREGFFVPDMTSQIVKLERSEDNILLFGNLESIKDFTDVRDIVSAYKLLIEKDIPAGEAINVCSGVGVKFKDLLDRLLRLSKKEIILKQDPQRVRPTEISLLVGNNQKLTKLTGWQPKYTLDQTLQDTLEYWRRKKND